MGLSSVPKETTIWSKKLVYEDVVVGNKKTKTVFIGWRSIHFDWILCVKKTLNKEVSIAKQFGIEFHDNMKDSFSHSLVRFTP